MADRGPVLLEYTTEQLVTALLQAQERSHRLEVRLTRVTEELRWRKVVEALDRRNADLVKLLADQPVEPITKEMLEKGFQKMRSVQEAVSKVEKESFRGFTQQEYDEERVKMRKAVVAALNEITKKEKEK